MNHLQRSALDGLFQHPDQAPRLALGQRPAFLDPHQITDGSFQLGSDALGDIVAYGSVVLDFDIVFSGAEVGFRNMLENNLEGQDNFSGSISIIPEPATMTILGLGGLVLLRKRKQHKTGR